MAACGHLTKAGYDIFSFLREHDGKACSKREIAERLSLDRTTVDRQVRFLRRQGMVRSQAVYAIDGSQRENLWFVGSYGDEGGNFGHGAN